MLGLPNEAKEAFFMAEHSKRKDRKTDSFQPTAFSSFKRMFNFFVELYIKDDSLSNQAENLIR
jgi:hypothetical protein